MKQKLAVRVQRESVFEWSLYVNDRLMVSRESQEVCDNIAEQLEGRGPYFSESREVADSIRRYFEKEQKR